MAGTGSMADVMRYFEMKPGDFRDEYYKLSAEDKNALKAGIADGTLTY